MKTIIAATDLSAAATNAVNYAADMAMAIHADLLLVYTFEVPVAYAEVPIAIDLDAMKRSAEFELNKYRQKLSERTGSGLLVSIEVRPGTFFEELKVICERINPYAVVMGSQGTTAAERFLFGGHAVHAIRDLEWPVITVPPGVIFSSIKKIGLACDFEKVVSNTPFHEIETLVNDFHAELHVLNTGRKDGYNPDTVFGTGMLKTILAPIKPRVHLIYKENTDEAIISFAENNNIDLLIVLPKRQGLIEKMLHKSHSKQMVLHSHVPVMALHGHV